ncbi:MAG: FAD-binding protein [candidate division KSB1 bacterium]|nr:FAD-binding protein [candidate division KSB1 bacterium]
MEKEWIELGGKRFPLYSVNTLVVGSGAAALNAAIQLVRFGQSDVAIVTEKWGAGTSNNAGSDKQTYYKLSLAGDQPDSPYQMAEDLFAGGCMHGDIALCEAQGSAQAFFYLVSLGVPFPHDRYGGYVGYKTDHDPRQRATSAGPKTSRFMFECLAREVKRLGIPVLDEHDVVALFTRSIGGEKHVVGALALDKKNLSSETGGFVFFSATNIVLGTGGPGGMYRDSVYPESQIGSTGMAFEIGAIGNNLTESQFGLASIQFRWNVSGTYQQVIPRYISTDQEGGDEREFLNDYFPDMRRLATAIFLKGYQWPFDPRKVANFGSSLIDVLVYQERVVRKRRVFLDYRRNPSGAGKLEDFSFDLLEHEAYEYLRRSGALFGAPIDRLQKMNQPAIDLYREHGIDLTREPLEIAVCAQHNNGGLRGNIWWESNIRHLFPVGEVNGTHGVYRPGGSALNSGQVGSMRAALYIAKRYGQPPLAPDDFVQTCYDQAETKLEWARSIVQPGADDGVIERELQQIRERMSAHAGIIRDPRYIAGAAEEAWLQYRRLRVGLRIGSVHALPQAFRLLDLCLTHAVYLEAIREYIAQGGKSRGSYLVVDPQGEVVCEALGDQWRFRLAEPTDFVSRKILEIWLDEDGSVRKQWVDIRPIPREDTWFENVWNEYLRDRIVV